MKQKLPAALVLIFSLWSLSCAALDSEPIAVTVPIGPAGGELLLTDGARLVIPAGALTKPVEITFKQVQGSLTLDGHVPISQLYSLEPSGQTFNGPVTLYLPYDEKLVGGNTSQVRMLLSSDNGSTWEGLSPVGSVEPHVAGGHTTHFSLAIVALGTGAAATAEPAPTPPPGTQTQVPEPTATPQPTATPLPGSPDGCSEASGPGCSGCACEQDVCTVQPVCCQTAWSTACVLACSELGACGSSPQPSAEPEAEPTVEPAEPAAANENSCQELCGLQAASGCYCDETCVAAGDCCPDACEFCGHCPGETGGCGDGTCDAGETCQNCAADCGPCGEAASCAGICGEQAESGCYCDPACLEYNDCCEDACQACQVCP